MKSIIFIAILFATTSGKSQTGTITGNAYWKYNDYVGNKPDAGADVYVYFSDTTKQPLNTQCDVQGNFKFDKVDDGQYLVLIISKATNTPGVENFIQFDILNSLSLKYFGFDIHQYQPGYDSVNYCKKIYENSLSEKINVWKMNKQIKEREGKKLIYYRAIHNVLVQIPYCFKTAILLLNLNIQPKIYIQEVEIKGGNTKTVISDFGITYL